MGDDYINTLKNQYADSYSSTISGIESYSSLSRAEACVITSKWLEMSDLERDNFDQNNVVAKPVVTPEPTPPSSGSHNNWNVNHNPVFDVVTPEQKLEASNATSWS